MDFSRIRVRFRCASDGMLRYVRQRADGDVALGYQWSNCEKDLAAQFQDE
jgi:hypothetical protein